MLYDAERSIADTRLSTGPVLDQVAVRLTEGSTVPEAVSAAGGIAEVIEAVLASLGRVTAFSDFRTTPR